MAVLVVALLALPLTSCNYSLRSAGGFPRDLRTMFVAPLENKTTKFELDQQIYLELSERLPRALGLRAASQENADVIVRGTITRYTDAAVNFRGNQQGASSQVVQHQVTVDVQIQIINVRQNAYIWEGTASGIGEYQPDTQNDEVARVKALQSLLQKIVDGAQSQW